MFLPLLHRFCYRILLKNNGWINSDSTVTQKCKQCVISLCIQTLDPIFLDRIGMEIWAHSQIKLNNSLLLKTFLIYLMNIALSNIERRSVPAPFFPIPTAAKPLGQSSLPNPPL